SFNLSAINTNLGGSAVIVESPDFRLGTGGTADVGELGTERSDCEPVRVPGLFQLFDLPFFAKNWPATPLQATMAASSSSSHPMKVVDTPQADGSSVNPRSKFFDA